MQRIKNFLSFAWALVNPEGFGLKNLITKFFYPICKFVERIANSCGLRNKIRHDSLVPFSSVMKVIQLETGAPILIVIVST